VACGFVVPFLIWNLLMGAVIYFHHTHPNVTWYNDIDEWETARDGVSGTVLITFPFRLGRILNNIMEHPAHHLDVRVPLYNLERAQQTLNEQNVHPLTQPLNYQHILACTRRCKLYDYTAHRWLGFDGEYTSERAAPAPSA
jgi:omega-6 fatty acid desaturase (delta-12 desaturase)